MKMFQTVVAWVGGSNWASRLALSAGQGAAVIVVVIIVAVILLAAITIMPALLVWSVNELLEQAGVAYQIAWNFWSWFSGLVLLMLVGRG